VDDREKRQLENALLREGLAGLSDPDLIQQLANLVSNWNGDRHRFLEDLINQCDADKRYEMYHAIAPKLRFKALTLSAYESNISMRASGLVSQGRMRVEGANPDPIEIRGEKFERVPEQLGTAALATLKCHKCNHTEQYLSDTPAGAMIMARKDGWVREKGVNKEVCRVCDQKAVA